MAGAGTEPAQLSARDSAALAVVEDIALCPSCNAVRRVKRRPAPAGCILGVKPGLTGALALYDMTLQSITMTDLPVCHGEMELDAVLEGIREAAPRLVIIESPAGWDGRMSRRSLVAFGRLHGMAESVCPCASVARSTWKAHYDLTGADAQMIVARARRLWPRAGWLRTGRGDRYAVAALIARYGAGLLMSGCCCHASAPCRSCPHRQAGEARCA
ncbi:MAG TPA: hypothetical protein VHG92_07295 [Afifellaceae bacterium]|nr:hypothetical protein [Afifellaceae bacterium]